MSIDSDEVAVSILLTGDDIDASACDTCLRPAFDWPRKASYHPLARPGAMFKAALYCADCMPRSYDDDGKEVRTFCGTRHAFTDGEGYACGCFA